MSKVIKFSPESRAELIIAHAKRAREPNAHIDNTVGGSDQIFYLRQELGIIENLARAIVRDFTSEGEE